MLIRQEKWYRRQKQQPKVLEVLLQRIIFKENCSCGKTSFIKQRIWLENLQWALQISSPAQSQDIWSVVTDPRNGFFHHLGLSRDNTTPLFAMARGGQIFRAAREELHLWKRPCKSKYWERLCARSTSLGGQWYLSESQGKVVVQGRETQTQGSATAGSHTACTLCAQPRKLLSGMWSCHMLLQMLPVCVLPLWIYALHPVWKLGQNIPELQEETPENLHPEMLW